MTNLEFKNKFPLPNVSYEGLSLEENHNAIEYIKDMFRYATDFSEETIITLILGKGTYNLGGLTSFYADAAILEAYEAISFYIETGWWPIGLDKAYIKSNQFKPLQKNQFYVKGESGDIILGCTASQGNPNWHYTAAIVKPERVNTLFELLEDSSNIKFDGIEFEFEDIQLTGSSFSLVSVYDLAKV